MSKRRKTKTSSFGSGGRESHDSRRFYAGKMYRGKKQDGEASGKETPVIENPIPRSILDTIRNSSSEFMDCLPDNSVHLMVTSPPYNVRKEYDDDLDLEEYLALLNRVFAETFRVLVPGGRACVNIANLGRKPYIPLNAYLARLMTEIGFLMRGEIIWDKGASAGNSTAWGSWMSASNPTLRDVHEYILVFSKSRFKRERMGRKPTILRDEFLEYTKSIWRFPTASASRIGHPAPFPMELPRRLISLYTFAGDIILDPFIGSGTTALAALKTGRHYVGFEVSEAYCRLAEQRIAGVNFQGEEKAA